MQEHTYPRRLLKLAVRALRRIWEHAATVAAAVAAEDGVVELSNPADVGAEGDVHDAGMIASFAGQAWVTKDAQSALLVQPGEHGAVTPEQRWQYELDREHGVNWLVTFAAQHYKPLAIPE